MKKKHFILIIIFLLALNSYGQCLCGDFKLQIRIDDLFFKDENSNYELIIIEKPERFIYNSRSLTKKDFTNDTLNLTFRTGAGIKNLNIELKNKNKLSSMQLTILNMTYDNDYFIDLTSYNIGNYVFDWKKIDACQTQNKTSRIVECEGIKFIQLDLQSKNLNFNNNKIKVQDLEYFLNKNNNSTQIKNDEAKDEIKERIESLLLSEIDSIYHLEKDKYLFTQRIVIGNGNHYADQIILRTISFSENEITLYPINIEIKELHNGRLDDNGFLIIEQHQSFNFKDKMFVYYDDSTQTLKYQFNSIDINFWETATFKSFIYKFVNGKFKLVSENLKKVKLE